MPPTQNDTPPSPQESDSDSPIPVSRQRPRKSPLSSVTSLPYRRSSASLSTLFASTTSLPTPLNAAASSGDKGGTVTPPASIVNGSIFSPAGSTAVRSSPIQPSSGAADSDDDIKPLIVQAFAPHVSVLASPDTEELIRHKGINGGLLELLRPFGERVQGKVTIRDGSGASRSWEDFGVRFVGVKDGLDSPRTADRRSVDTAGGSKRNSRRASFLEYKPARLRTGGNVGQIEELVERHLTFAEEQSGPVEADYLNHDVALPKDQHTSSPFYQLYLRRLLCGLPLVPSETISHPVASVIAISSRSPSPIEELRNLFHSSNSGENRLPQWVHNEFLRYYVLVHDDDFDDITKSMSLFDQMKRHFGLHCHLLRLRSMQCVPTDDGSMGLPSCAWISAAEEMAEIIRRETIEEEEDPSAFIFESDATAIRSLVREMVTQSIVPSMERASAAWNDQVASRRRGLSGRFMSLSKRITTFGGGRNTSMAALGGSSSNYDSLQGFYRPDAPEAVMRKLADYAVMLRDFKLAQATFEILCQDFKNDKAWRYYAGANEMAAIATLLANSGVSNRVRVESVDQYLETAYYSYITRVGAPYNALRVLVLGIELLKLRGGSALDDAARWCTRILDDRLVGSVGHALITERAAACFSIRKGAVSSLHSGDRRRKAAFWSTLAADAWLRMDKTSQAEGCLAEATRLYGLGDGGVRFDAMAAFLRMLEDAVRANRAGPQPMDDTEALGDEDTLVEPLQPLADPASPRSTVGGHRKSMSVGAAAAVALPPIQTAFDDPLGAVPSIYEAAAPAVARTSHAREPSSALSPHKREPSSFTSNPLTERKDRRDDGFE